jgi:hypothetical protein
LLPHLGVALQAPHLITVQNNKRGGRRGTTKRSGSRRNATLTDQPKRPIRTYSTRSCLLPKVTETTVVKGTAVGSITASASIDVKTSYAFSLANANIGSGYYDQYKLDAVRFTIIPQNNAIGLVTNSTTLLTPLYCVIDYDDSSVLANVAAAEAYSTCIVLNPGESLERVFQPRMAIGAYGGTVFTQFANVAPMWIDSASTGVQHYGIKTLVPAVAAAQTQLQSWDVIIEFYFSMRKAI